MKTIVNKVVKRLPAIGPIVRERDELRAEMEAVRKLWCLPGHFHSPIPSLDEIKENEERIFGDIPQEIPGVDLNKEQQMRLFDEFKNYYTELPFKPFKTKHLRYFFENPYYLYSDAIFLYCMIRHIKPKQIIEVGSGYSSCVILDTNELFFNNAIQCVFIEPNAERLLSIIKRKDRKRIELINERLQIVPLGKFETLSDGDILFIDSTHVSKTGSDVNHILFEILPYLKKGVYIHFHDIFYPFEYPKEWVYEGRAWNESYLLRAFLQYNQHFEIIFFNTFLEYFYESAFVKEMPLCMRNKGGSIWIQKK